MRALSLLLALLLAACHSMPETLPPPVAQEPGNIIDLHNGEALSPGELVERLAQAPRLIVGEQHDNADHHALQLWLLRSMSAERQQGSLLLEMLNPDQQSKVDEVKRSLDGRRLPDGLPATLAWQPGWDWSLYGPLVGYALKQPYPLLAANLDTQDVRRIYAQAPVLSGARSNARPVTQLLSAQIRESHCGLLPESQVPSMLAVQQQRDRRMAERLLAAPTPALLFAGSFHGRRDLGVPLHMADLDQGQEVVVLILAEQGSEVSPASADYVWYTPPQPPKDYCAQLKP
ncbi:ChaN family lipoprotein [Pseudomonas idahonensis]|uniref:ChaN family lipoprotein n=1 Tax=Pseudomonas idahonensis TaxID=2942628 RepID=A0ABT5QD34_9PSED|nr:MULTISPECIES: ChaN family lipoprotein [Pseudomonas]MBS7559006.1 ChaN family lipoprotein [Pseudomonas sp. RC4D1]MCO7578521.1 ChaN family lipoprotein [Pseudomonas protegens]MCO7584342.1 ChaN family lipoprotein [Pseudomonas chlororaphis]MCO7601607.1 ChaN family lipoprotein [Pseudomonas chlororaphis]MDD1023090.1 ChaN family lipoprotein [Pseudomonas idahonensis]